MIEWQKVIQRTKVLAELLKSSNMTITTAESCTGGGVGYALTSIDGSSKWFAQGVISYSDQVKSSLLHVQRDTLLKHGAVSEQAAIEMLNGALDSSHADCAIAITGYAGPASDLESNQVGKIWIGTCIKKYCSNIQCFMYNGSRNANRQQAVYDAINNMTQLLEQFKRDNPNE
jgi:nicotinamide-nucleotide amidase